jgi:hypothetical protein
MRHKIIIKGILILIAVLLIMMLLFRSRLPFGKSNSSFASGPEKEISKIEFSSAGNKLSLEKKGDSWLINGKTEARKSGILFILRVLHEIQIKSPVSDDLFRAEITEKGLEPVKVKVFEKRKMVRSFMVYKTHSNSYGNIMKIRERSKPFIVYVPGYDGDIGSAFTLNELFWQPYTVFNLLPSEIASVRFENLSDTLSSFLISCNNHHYTLSSSDRQLTGWDSTLVTRYLSYFAWIPLEKWIFDITDKEKKAIESTQPLYRITVITSDGRKSVLSLWEKRKGEERTDAKDSDRLLGRTQSSEDFFVMRYFDIDPLIKKRSYFFPE